MSLFSRFSWHCLYGWKTYRFSLKEVSMCIMIRTTYNINSKIVTRCFQTAVLEKTLESPMGTNDIKPINPKGNQLNIHLRDWCLSWSSSILATWCEELTHWKRPGCWERLRAGGEGGNSGWDGWMASLTQWTWVWANSRRQRRTGKPGTL